MVNTVNGLNATTGHRRGSSSTNGQIRASHIANDALTKANDALNAENQNVSSLNEQYLQQLNALRVKSQEKENVVEELEIKVDEWQSKYEALESMNEQNWKKSIF